MHNQELWNHLVNKGWELSPHEGIHPFHRVVGRKDGSSLFYRIVGEKNLILKIVEEVEGGIALSFNIFVEGKQVGEGYKFLDTWIDSLPLEEKVKGLDYALESILEGVSEFET